jgi:hypothetical protein
MDTTSLPAAFLHLKRQIVLVAAFAACLGPNMNAANLAQAVVRQKVNQVTVAPSVNASARPVSTGAVVENQNVVRTGTESRAELEFTDLTLARMGANSIFSFDAEARALEFTQGALLFSKPPNSGRVEIRTAAITAAITGSTGFISNQPLTIGVKPIKGKPQETSTVLGMIEGTIKGTAAWQTPGGQQRLFRFSCGPGEALIAQSKRQPIIVQFNLPQFVRSSPLFNAFERPIPNQLLVNQAMAQYVADERRGFIEPTNVTVVTQPRHIAWVSNTVRGGSFDASVDQLRGPATPPNAGGFIPIGGTGIIRGQLVWMTSADLDLHLTLPDQQEVFFANPSVTFSNGKATAVLDHDNRGGTIDARPDKRVENIVVNGDPASGTYTFFVNNFSGSGLTGDRFKLRIGTGNNIQVLNGVLTDNQNSQPLSLVFPAPGG